MKFSFSYLVNTIIVTERLNYQINSSVINNTLVMSVLLMSVIDT
ncbi:hypothetical protein C427_4909 [Paraglaciecola psychrophila 170]|uniref:Uncharacterized protein n=1 Tax=Paraglaciecola psychrophila 170 TaxID=1129794 RepID=K7AYT9_9ALTE|nr:hypothetical protein C427_4909 [Paraglaciecola psychrophila 170]GAC40240.1 hypothetical protein GPSY_4637 [Paraglaciecola psychrophila 170]